jgi:hypothetical protein
MSNSWPGRCAFALAALVVFVALHAVGCGSTSALLITGALPPTATVGVAYSGSLLASGGTGTYAWTVGGLPPGLVLSGANSATLTISGSPTASGTFTVNATVMDTKSRIDTSTDGVTVSASPVLAINGSLPFTGSVGSLYSGTLNATGGTAPYTWTVENLPAGITAAGTNTSTLVASGTPTTSGTYQVAITLTDSVNAVQKSSITIAISSSAGLAITGALAATGNVGAAYSGSLTASGGTPPYTWTVTGLPAGVSASGTDTATVAVAGIPTAAASYEVSALVTDSKSKTALYSAAVVIAAAQALAADACATAPTPRGNESAFTQPHAFALEGYDANHTPLAWAGSFTPDGSGGIVAADVDEISEVNGPASYKIDLAGSSYSFGTDGAGCLYLAFNGANAAAPISAHSPNRALGGGAKSFIPSGLAENQLVVRHIAFRFTIGSPDAGSHIETAPGETHSSAAGQIFQQTVSDFALAKFSPRFAFGVSGWYIPTENQIERAAMAGSIDFAARTGALANGVADNDIGGDASGQLTGVTGSLVTPSTTTGRGTGSYTLSSPLGDVSFDFAYYAVNGSDFIFITTDAAFPGNFLLSGRALAAASPASPLEGNYAASFVGIPADAVAVSLRPEILQRGTISVANDGNAQLDLITTGGWDESPKTLLTGAVTAADAATGRTTFAFPDGQPLIAYRTAASAPSAITAFVVGTDANSFSGILVQQPQSPSASAR